MSSRAQFRQNLIKAFSNEELQTVCFDLGLDPETLPGHDEGKARWAENILRYFELAGRVPDLARELQKQRPNLNWGAGWPAAQPITPPTPDPLQALINEIENKRRTIRIVNVNVPLLPGVIGLVLALALAAGGMWLAVTPTHMPEGVTHINVAVANFGLRTARGIQPSADGELLSRELYTGLKQELDDLGKKLGGDFTLTVWHDSMGHLAKRTNIGTIADEAQAAKLAQAISATVVIYGVIDATSGVTKVVPQFYVPATRGEADEIVGPYEFGRAIETNTKAGQDFWLQKDLRMRQRALSGFIVGLSYDLFGATQEAQTAFEAIDADASLGWQPQDGKEILYFFIGRQLLQRQVTLADVAQRNTLINEAEMWFTRAISVNVHYARAYNGLGAVHYLRAKLIAPQARLDEPDFEMFSQQATLAYQRGLTEAQAAPLPLVVNISKVGLAYVARLTGEAHLVRAANTCAGELLDGAELALADEALTRTAAQLAQAAPELAAHAQYREAARAYVAQGATLEQLGCVRRLQGQKPAAVSFFTQAIVAYGTCIMQQQLAPNDRVIREDIVKKECAKYQKRAQDRRDEAQ